MGDEKKDPVKSNTDWKPYYLWCIKIRPNRKKCLVQVTPQKLWYLGSVASLPAYFGGNVMYSIIY